MYMCECGENEWKVYYSYWLRGGLSWSRTISESITLEFWVRFGTSILLHTQSLPVAILCNPPIVALPIISPLAKIPTLNMLHVTGSHVISYTRQILCNMLHPVCLGFTHMECVFQACNFLFLCELGSNILSSASYSTLHLCMCEYKECTYTLFFAYMYTCTTVPPCRSKFI